MFFLVLTCAKYKLLNAVGLILVSSVKSPSQVTQGSGNMAPYHVEKKKGIIGHIYSLKVEFNSFWEVLMFYFVFFQTKYIVLAMRFVNFNT